MIGKLQTLDSRLLARQCVACGYDGSLLQDGRAQRCARCGVDLKLRPARSYAEMESLFTEPLVIEPPVALVEVEESLPQEKIIHRWLAFLFLTMIGFMAMLYLCATVLTV